MSDNLPKLTVSELTSIIKNTLESSFFGLTVEGEISGFRPGSTGHWFFSLKDDNAVISAVVWKSIIPSIGFLPKDGQKVIVKGNLNVFQGRGTYQISCTSMKICGDGDILAKLEERKNFYFLKGFFDSEHKKTIPLRPSKVAVITSPTGAALQDILQVTGRRNSSMDIIILPAVVQGSEAAETIACRIKQVNDFDLADVMIVGRGGGSIEDLLPFSEDCVINAIYNSRIPVISAVGHEIDWAISDFVADLRAPTPSAAAELVSSSQDDQKKTVNKYMSEMKDAINQKLIKSKLKLSSVNPVSFKYLIENRVTYLFMENETGRSELISAINEKLDSYRHKLEIYKSNIQLSSPIDILNRGYSIVSKSDGTTVRDVNQIELNSSLTVRFSSGKAGVIVKEVSNG